MGRNITNVNNVQNLYHSKLISIREYIVGTMPTNVKKKNCGDVFKQNYTLLNFIECILYETLQM